MRGTVGSPPVALVLTPSRLGVVAGRFVPLRPRARGRGGTRVFPRAPPPSVGSCGFGGTRAFPTPSLPLAALVGHLVFPPPGGPPSCSGSRSSGGRMPHYSPQRWRGAGRWSAPPSLPAVRVGHLVLPPRGPFRRACGAFVLPGAVGGLSLVLAGRPLLGSLPRAVARLGCGVGAGLLLPLPPLPGSSPARVVGSFVLGEMGVLILGGRGVL